MKHLLQYRKKALITSAIIFCIFFFHLVGVYVYSDGKYVGLPGGGLSVWVVADASTIEPMDPLNYGKSKLDDFVLSMLFRGLIRYNTEQEIYEGDLANCDISDLKKIQCELREDGVWSDGSDMKVEDITATVAIFAEHASTNSMKNIFKNTRVTAVEWKKFTLETSGNSNIIEAMTYPILRSDVIDQIKNNRLKKESYITSGPFIYDESVDETEYNFHRITLKKNPNYKKTVYLEKFHIKIFPDTAALERGADTVMFVIPPANRQNLSLSARFKPISYANYEFFGLFFHTDKLDKNIRNILHKYLANYFEEKPLDVVTQKPVNSIFQTGSALIGPENLALNFEGFMSEKWFKKKHFLLAETQNINTTLTSGATVPKLQYFRNGGGNAILYSDNPTGEITLTGKVPATTTSVTINNYTLREYNAGNTNFVYKISLAIGNIQDGKNVYKLELAQKNGTILTEELVIYQTTDTGKMQEYQRNVDAELIASLNTPEKIAEREKEKSEKIAKIEALSDGFYYNNNLEPFTLKLTFLADKEIPTKYADHASNALRTLGINIEAIPLTAREFDEMIKAGKKDYDAIIVGLQSPGTIAHMGSAFFSGENGNANFSNLTSKNFVALFDSLKNVSDLEKSQKIQEEIITFMNDMSFFFPISRPEHTFYIDKNIRGLTIPKVISSFSDLSHILDTASLNNKYQTSLEGKNFSGFVSWIFGWHSSK